MPHFQVKPFAAAAALTAFALPAAAQDAICNGVGANGQWIGGGEAQSDISTAADYLEQMALVLANNQYVSVFTLSETTTVRMEAAARGTGDPLIDVIDGTGQVILSDDDSGGNSAARAEASLDPGTYCVALSSYGGSPMTAFVRIGRPEQEPLTDGIGATTASTGGETPAPEGGGSCVDAAPLGTLAGPLSGSGSVDASPYWSFTLTEPTAVSITAANEDADPVLTLYDATDTYIDENDDFDGLNSRLDIENPLPAGDYCIQIDALNDTALPIEVGISEYDPAAVLLGQIERGETAPPLDGSIPIQDLGVLENRIRVDGQISTTASWYSVDVNQGGLLLIEAIAGGDGDPWVVIFDDLGRQIALNDDYGDSLDSLVTARVNGGTYLVAVKQVGAATEGLIRMVFERYIPAP